MPKKPDHKDWTRHDVLYAVRRTGTNLQQLSINIGYARGTLGSALHTPHPKFERIIAEHLCLPVETVWPTRYHADGTPRSGRGERGIGRYVRKADRPGPAQSGSARPVKANDTSVKTDSNVNVQG